MKKLINYNRAVFHTRATFTKIWMITMPLFVLAILFAPINGASLVDGLPESGPLVVFSTIFLLFYPIRNYFMVIRYIKQKEEKDFLNKGEKATLDFLEKLENENR